MRTSLPSQTNAVGVRRAHAHKIATSCGLCRSSRNVGVECWNERPAVEYVTLWFFECCLASAALEDLLEMVLSIVVCSLQIVKLLIQVLHLLICSRRFFCLPLFDAFCGRKNEPVHHMLVTVEFDSGLSSHFADPIVHRCVFWQSVQLF